MRRQVVAQLHEGADRGGRGVENGNAVALADAPEPAAVGTGRGAFVDHHRGAVRQRPVGDVAVSGNPAHIGGTPEHVVLAQIEHPAAGQLGVQQVTGGGMLDALGLAGGAGGVEQEQRMLGVNVLGRTFSVRGFRQFVGPKVASIVPGDLRAGVPEHDDPANTVLAVLQRLIHRGLQVHQLAATPAGVGGDHHPGFGINHAVIKRARRETTEHDRVNCADTGAGMHRDHGFRAHGHVDHHPVAARHALPAQGRPQAGDGLAQLAVAERAAFSLLALVEDGGPVRRVLYPGPQAGFAGVQFPIGKPGIVRRL